MTAQILDGKATAAAIKEDLTRRVAALARAGTVPGLGTVLVGDDPGSRAYVAGKHRDSVQVGITSIRRDLPADATQQARLEPVYETLAGWPETTAGARSWAQLPANAIKYVRRVEELIGAPVALLSTSPDRDDTIMVRDPFV